MKKNSAVSKIIILVVFVLIPFALAQANDNRPQGVRFNRPDTHDKGRDNDRWRGWPYKGRHYEVLHRGNRYFYHGGFFFQRSGVNFVVVSAPHGAVVPVLPFGYVTYTFGPGIAYYYLDGVYYKQVPQGYVVVPEDEFDKLQKQKKELEASKPPETPGFIVNIPNTDGTFTPVELKKNQDGYTGPQGEFYKEHPSVEQLKVLYGK
jgi:hypothetical protein